MNYVQRSFDKQCLHKVVDDEIVLIAIIYVDGFLGLYREDHAISELHGMFKWGSLS